VRPRSCQPRLNLATLVDTYQRFENLIHENMIQLRCLQYRAHFDPQFAAITRTPRRRRRARQQQ
jgi:hypothetical protein